MPVYQGDYYAKGFILKSLSTGLAMDITGWTFEMKIRNSLNDTNPLLTLTTTNSGIVTTSTSAGRIEMRITSVQSDTLPLGTMVFDIRRTDITPGPIWLFGGSFKVKKPVTR